MSTKQFDEKVGSGCWWCRSAEVSQAVLISNDDTGVDSVLTSIKLVVATVYAGVHPSRTFPVVLNCGKDVRCIL